MLLLALLGLAVTACPSPRSVLYPAPAPRPIEPDGAGRVVTFETSEGRTGWALHHEAAPGAPTLVFFHGNGDQVAHLTALGRAFERRGLGFHAIEYPGYGPAADQPVSERAIYATAEAGLVHLRDALGVAAERTVLMGQSLGTGVAAEMATRGLGARVVLLSPFTSVPDMAEQHFSAAASLLVVDTFDTRSKATHIELPVLIAHGERDRIVPVSMARELDAAFPRSELHVWSAAGHNDVWRVGGRAWLDRLEAFARGADTSAKAGASPEAG